MNLLDAEFYKFESGLSHVALAQWGHPDQSSL